MIDRNLYVSLNLADSIKKQAKMKGIALGTMLTDLDLGMNTMSNLRHGRMIAADSLARIADYLDCSVDFLLARTINPLSHKIGDKAVSFAERLREAMHIRNLGALDLIEKIVKYDAKAEDIMDAQDIGDFADGHRFDHLTPGKIQNLAKALNVSMAQLWGMEEITVKNIRPYNLITEEIAVLYEIADFLHQRPNSSSKKSIGTPEEITLYVAAHSSEETPDTVISIPKSEWDELKSIPPTKKELK